LNPVLTRPLELKDGCFTPSEEPGLGIPFDWQKLKSFRVNDEN
jgi:L-alanine-DL-glutamate epimerase-like enolase superfamily enzyme